MSNLKDQLIRLGNKEPSLRKHLRPILSSLEGEDWSDLVKNTKKALKKAVDKSYFKLQRGADPVENFEGDYLVYELFASKGNLRQALLSLERPVADYAPQVKVSFQQERPRVFKVKAEVFTKMEGVLGRNSGLVPDPTLDDRNFKSEMKTVLSPLVDKANNYAKEKIEIWYEDHKKDWM